MERHNYYTGKAPAEVYIEDPFPYKIREKDAIQRYLEADEKLSQIDMKIRYYDVTLKFLEEIIETYQVVHIRLKMPSSCKDFNQDSNDTTINT